MTTPTPPTPPRPPGRASPPPQPSPTRSPTPALRPPQSPPPPSNGGAANRLLRLPAQGWLAGVCAGVGRRLDLDPLAVRLAVIILTIVTGGLAAVVYLVAWVAMPTPAALGLSEEELTEAESAGAYAPESAPAGSWGWQRGEAADASRAGRRPPRSGSIRLGLGVTLITLGVLLACRELGLWLSDAVVWPLVIAAGGAALIMRQIRASGERDDALESESERGSGSAAGAGPSGPAEPFGQIETGVPAEPSTSTTATPRQRQGQAQERRSRRRLGAGLGIALILAAATLLLFATGIVGQLLDAAVAVAVIAAAAALVVTPFLVASTRRAQEERRQRIRSEERAEVAAHLHDSVLQTLALIQRQAGDSPEIATLARRQERELREWLSGRSDGERAASLAAALETAAADVEGDLKVTVDAVTVGDRPLDRRGEALVAAAREAIVNAARFGQNADSPPRVSVYAELNPDRASVFVRDRGPGFDPAAIPADRRGVRESIIGRMERHGGQATIRSQPGEGTEIELTMEFA